VCCNTFQCVVEDLSFDFTTRLRVLQCVAVCCSMLKGIAVRYSVLQCVAACVSYTHTHKHTHT